VVAKEVRTNNSSSSSFSSSVAAGSSGSSSYLPSEGANYSTVVVVGSPLYGSTATNEVSVWLLAEPNSVYCPRGAARPIEPLRGYFTIGGTATTRTDLAPCPVGSYCAAGVVTQCPAGRFGRQGLLTDAACSGLCAKGHYCPLGSTSRTMYPCPAGRYGAEEGLSSPLCSGSCSQPLSCPEGSIIGTPIITA
jgi:hypothetical protein